MSVLGAENEEKEETENKKKDTSDVVALLDLGESVSNLNIIVDGSPRFTRDIFIGGRDFTIRISNALGVTIEEAEQLKKNPGDKLDAVVNACESMVMNIVEELMLSFEFFSTENNLEIGHLFLTGGGALLQGIRDVFNKNLKLDISRWDPLSRLELSDSIEAEL